MLCGPATTRRHAPLPSTPSPPSHFQEMFQRVYGVRSSSNNNLWLRKKLVEAVNTRPRGGERASRTSSAQLPASVAKVSAGAEGCAGPPASMAAGGGTLRRRRKKSSVPVRASDGVQVNRHALSCRAASCAAPCQHLPAHLGWQTEQPPSLAGRAQAGSRNAADACGPPWQQCGRRQQRVSCLLV